MTYYGCILLTSSYIVNCFFRFFIRSVIIAVMATINISEKNRTGTEKDPLISTLKQDRMSISVTV